MKRPDTRFVSVAVGDSGALAAAYRITRVGTSVITDIAGYSESGQQIWSVPVDFLVFRLCVDEATRQVMGRGLSFTEHESLNRRVVVASDGSGVTFQNLRTEPIGVLEDEHGKLAKLGSRGAVLRFYRSSGEPAPVPEKWMKDDEFSLLCISSWMKGAPPEEEAGKVVRSIASRETVDGMPPVESRPLHPMAGGSLWFIGGFKTDEIFAMHGKDGQLHWTKSTHGWISGYDASEDGSLIVTATVTDPCVEALGKSGDNLWSKPVRTSEYTAVVVAADSSRVALAPDWEEESEAGGKPRYSVHVLDSAGGEEMKDVFLDTVQGLALSQNGTLLLAGSECGDLVMYRRSVG